jgi:hypothetical protein
MMKKILAIVLLVTISIFLFGCGGDKGTSIQEIKCNSECLKLCETNGMQYYPSVQKFTETQCQINCLCSKDITFAFTQ